MTGPIHRGEGGSGRPMPDFVVFGSAKCATTWLQWQLQRHPDVYMPDPELHFFSREFERGLDWYAAWMVPPPDRPAPRLVGEKSNSYLHEPPAARRMLATLPRARLIGQFRDPVERAYSDYCMLFRRGEIGGDPWEHLDPRRAASGRLLAWGRYAEQLLPILDGAAPERLLLLTFEGMKRDPHAHLAAVRRFLDLPYRPPESAIGRVKVRNTAIIPPAWKPFLDPLRPVVRPLRGSRAFRALHGRLARPIRHPELPAELRARMVDHFAPHNDAFAALTGLDVSEWQNLRPPVVGAATTAVATAGAEA